MRMRTTLAVCCLLCMPLPRAATPASVGGERGFAALANGLQFHCVEVPGADGICVVLGVRAGTDHDPPGRTGLAAAAAELLRLRHEDAPAAERLQVALRGPATLLSATRAARELDATLHELRPLLAGALELDADALERARARAALRADDASQIFPGPMLQLMAQRALLAGTPAGRQTVGIADELAALDDAAVRDWIRAFFRPRHAVLAVLGGAPRAQLEDAVRRAFADLPPGDSEAPTPAVHDSLRPVTNPRTHDRVDGPYVSLAVRAPPPDDPDHLPFLVAMNAVRARAARVLLEPRGREGLARFPPLLYADDEGAPLALINRRGHDGTDFEAARDEIARFADTLRGARVTPPEIARAAADVSERLQLPPYPADVTLRMRDARSLYRRAVVLVTSELLGWPPDLADKVRHLPPARVQQVLDTVLAPASRHWFGLVPMIEPAAPARSPAGFAGRMGKHPAANGRGGAR